MVKLKILENVDHGTDAGKSIRYTKGTFVDVTEDRAAELLAIRIVERSRDLYNPARVSRSVVEVVKG